MLDQTKVDQQLRQLNDQVIHDYEEELKQSQTEREHSAILRKQRRDQEREIFASLIDQERLDRLTQENEAITLDYLRQVRSPLVERPIQTRDDMKMQALSASLFVPNQIQVPVYAASLLASDPQYLEGNPGEISNPWVQPLDPNHLHLRAHMQGSGWSCSAVAYDPNIINAKAVVWYTFVPEKTGFWFLFPQIDLHGFYIAVSDDSWYNCDNSSVLLKLSSNVYQYFWNGEWGYTLIDIDEGNINVHRFYDKQEILWYPVNLKAGDRTYVRVIISLHTWARGGGSYSEINFTNGVANYISPLSMLATIPGVWS